VSARAGQQQLLCAHLSVMFSNIASGMTSGIFHFPFYVCDLSLLPAMTNHKRKMENGK
jgi:hypothetical protein